MTSKQRQKINKAGFHDRYSASHNDLSLAEMDVEYFSEQYLERAKKCKFKTRSDNLNWQTIDPTFKYKFIVKA